MLRYFRQISADYRWSFLGTSVLALTQLLQMIIAARLLLPTELGMWAVLMMLYRLLTPFVEAVNRAVIRGKSLGQTQIDTLFSLNVITGLSAAVLLFILADAVSQFFYLDGSDFYFGVFSLVFIVIGLGTLRGSLLQKDLQFRKLATIQVFASLCEFALFLVLLLQGWRLWSLLLAFMLRFSIQHLSYLIFSGYSVRFGCNINSIRPIIGFGKYDLGAQLLNYFYTNIDNILVGRLLGQTALGYYALAWDITVKPVSFFNPVILRVAFPLMAKASNVKKLYIEALKKVALVQLPVYSLLALLMYPLIALVYGQQWTPSAGPAVVLCGVALLRALAEPGASVLAVKGRVDFEFYFQFLNILVTVLSIFLFYYLKPEISSISFAMLLAHVLLMSYWFRWIWKHLIQSESPALQHK